MKKGKIQKTVRSKRGKNVSLEPFSFQRLREFYQLYLTSKSKWEEFLVLHFKNIEDAQKFIAQEYNNDKFTGYFVINNETKKMVGFIFGDETKKDSIMRTRAIGYEYEGLGYGYEAAQLFEALMKKAGYSSITISCDATNERTINLITRDGYQYEKTNHISFGPVSMDFLFYSKKL